MKRYFFLLSILASGAWSTTITSGSIYGAQGFGQNLNPVQIFGPNNFGIGWETGNVISSFPPACLTPTCTFDFSQSFTGGPVTGSPGSVSYNGTLYDLSVFGGFTVSLTLTFVSQQVTVPTSFSNGGTFATATWPATPFTATGSFTVRQGNTAVASDTLSGSGTAIAFFDDDTNQGIVSKRVTYTFATPEPGSIGLVSTGLLIAGLLSRRCSKRAH